MRKVTDVVTCSHTAGALRQLGTQQVKGLNRKWRWKPRHGLQARILPYPVSSQPWTFCVCVVGQPAAVFIFFLSSHLGITNLLSLCFFYPKKSPRFILLIELFLTLDCIYSICMQISFVFCLMIFT